MDAEGRKEELTADRESEVPLGKLEHLRVSEFHSLAKICERVFVSSFPLNLAGELQELRRLTNQVKRDVGRRDVFFEDRPMPTPLGVAMTQHQSVVTKPK